MKKYIELQKHEELADGDECRYVYSEEWRPNVHRSQMVGFEYRRPVPHTGDVQFLMEMSIMATVIVDCDGKSQDEIEEEAASLAVKKILASPSDYIQFENIMFNGSRVDDDECQPKNPGKYRMLEIEEIVNEGDECQNQLTGEWEALPDCLFDDTVTPHHVGKDCRRPITDEPRYRPFREGDVIEEGDQFRFSESCEWSFIKDSIGEEADASITGAPNFRKLIK